jgi:glycosyltransferase involved in cell wall biosynthesis
MSRELRTAEILTAPETILPTSVSEFPSPTISSSSTSHLPSPSNVLSGLRVCFLAGTLGQGGAERQLFYLLQALKNSGSDITLLSLTRGEYWEEPIRKLGIPVQWVGRSRSRLVRLFAVIKAARALKPEVIQSQHFYANGCVALAARVTGAWGVGAIRNDGFSEVSGNGPIFGRLNLRLPAMLAANSKAAIRNLRQLKVPERKLFYLPNVIDTSLFAPSVQHKKNAFVILGVGRMVPQKRFDRFLRIVSELRKHLGSRVSGILVGSGPQRQDLEALAHRLDLIPHGVSFVGSVSDVRKCFKAANMFLLTSDYEGTPNVVMEAMACGLPVVAANVGGVPDLIKHGETGFLFEPEDSNSAIAGLKRLAEEPELAAEMGYRARSFIEEHHSQNRLPERLAQLYRTVLAPGHAER